MALVENRTWEFNSFGTLSLVVVGEYAIRLIARGAVHRVGDESQEFVVIDCNADCILNYWAKSEPLYHVGTPMRSLVLLLYVVKYRNYRHGERVLFKDPFLM